MSDPSLVTQLIISEDSSPGSIALSSRPSSRDRLTSMVTPGLYSNHDDNRTDILVLFLLLRRNIKMACYFRTSAKSLKNPSSGPGIVA